MGVPSLNSRLPFPFSSIAKSQEELDHYWDALSEGGEKGQCGWLTDKYGLSWQIVPTALGQLMGDPDPEKAGRVTQAMLKMTKLDIAESATRLPGRLAAAGLGSSLSG